MTQVIERRALRDRVLKSITEHAVTLIVAPPVSGKATLVAQIADDLCAAGRGVAEAVEAEADGSTVTLLHVETVPQAALLKEVERRASAGQRFLLAAEQPLARGFAALRLRGEVYDFGFPDLALADDDVPAFLGGALPDEHSGRLVRALQERTEGWIGAWCLLRALHGQGHSLQELAKSFSGADRDLGQYFEDLIRPSVDGEVWQFLIDVGPLEHVSADLADAVTGRSDGRAMLERAAAQCAFFVNVDRNRQVYRPHRLFGEYLRHVAGRENIERLNRSFATAADWAAVKADWISAAQLYLKAGQPDKAVEILSRHTQDLITSRGEVLSYRQLALSLADEPKQVPSLASELALGSIFAGDFARASDLLDQLDNHADALSEQQRWRLESIRINVDFGFERFDRVIATAPRWLEQRKDAEPRYRAMVAIGLFWSYHAEIDMSGAYHALAIARTEVGRANAPFLDAWLMLAAAYQKREQGHFSEADTILSEAKGEGVVRHTLQLMHAAICCELGQTRQARRLLQQHLREGIKHSVVETAFAGWEAATRIALADKGIGAALALLEEAESVMASRHGERARRMIRLLRARFILQATEDVQTNDLGLELDFIAADSAALGLGRSVSEMARLELARYQARYGEPKHAISLVQPIISSALRQSRMRVWGEASLIYAGAVARLDDTGKALRMTWQTMERLSASGMHATATEEHVLLSPVIDELMARAQLPAKNTATAVLVRELAAGAGRLVSSEGKRQDEDNLVSGAQFTPMERKILSLAAQGYSNSKIAESLMIKVSTVKWHMQNIFGKLHVRSRTAAIAEARRLGLVG